MRLGAPVAVHLEHHAIDVSTPLGGADTLRIAFAADFHVGPNTPEALLDSAIATLHDARADLLLLGGDFVSRRPDVAGPLARRLGQVPAPLGRFAVLGNHDYWTDAAVVARDLTDAGIELFTNRQVRLPAPFQQVSLCGLDDHSSGAPDAEAAFAAAGPVRVVLMHAPSGLLDLGDRAFTVALCGHTHGGQIALPNGRPLITAHGPLSRRYNAGRYELGNGRTLLVTRGVGCTAVPFRLNAPAGVMICTLRSKGS